jgi:hypothetical protein
MGTDLGGDRLDSYVMASGRYPWPDCLTSAARNLKAATDMLQTQRMDPAIGLELACLFPCTEITKCHPCDPTTLRIKNRFQSRDEMNFSSVSMGRQKVRGQTRRELAIATRRYDPVDQGQHRPDRE